MLLDNYTLATIHRYAELQEIELSDRHMEILSFTFNYYQRNTVGPALYILKKKLQLAAPELNALFPHGLSSIYRWLNIPIHSVETGCADLADIQVSAMRQVYLDYNATTPIRKEVSDLLCSYYSGDMGYANPSSPTDMGKEAYSLIIEAKKTFADLWSVDPEELYFTGSCTEANNTFFQGLGLKNLENKGHFIVSAIEHPSILKTVRFLETLGFTSTLLPVDSDGIVQIATLDTCIQGCLDKGVQVLATSIMLVNNEIGTIQPVEDAALICSKYNIPLHSDITQALGKLPIHPKEIGVTSLTCSAHKIYGPKGIGLLYLDANIPVPPLIHGGAQEFGMRGGTENPGHMQAFALAAQLVEKERDVENKRIGELQKYLWNGLLKIDPDIRLVGSMEKRVTTNLSVGFPHINSRSLLLGLNKMGVYASAGSACSSGTLSTSSVIEAIGLDTKKYAVIRLSMGRQTVRKDLDYLLEYLPNLLNQLKKHKR